MSVDQFLLSADTTDLNYPDVRPTLDLNFARTKTLDPRITFTRASGGSYVGADGLIKYAGVNEPRFDHDPVTGESLGLLIEEVRTNFIKNSTSFDSNWFHNNANIGSNYASQIITNTNETLSPDGTNNAAKIIQANDGWQRILQGVTTTNNNRHTFSIFVKRGNSNACVIEISGNFNAGGRIRWNFNTETFSNYTVGNWNNLTFTKYPNGWYRLSGDFLATSNSGTTGAVWVFPGLDIFGVPASPAAYTYAYGYQLEAGSFPTSYIPTQGSIRTRARDTASIVGQNFSNFYNQIDSALFFSGRTVGTPNVTKLFGGVVDTSKGFISSLYFNVVGSPVVVAWSPLTLANLGAYVSNTLVKGILTYTSSQPTASWCRDGGTVGSVFNRSYSFGGSTLFGFPNTMNRLVIGSSPWGFDSVLNGTISRLTYWPKRLPNAQLQALTR